MTRITNVALAILIIAVSASTLLANQKFVGTDGNDQNSGIGYAQRWRTLSHALQNLEPGDTLTILNGNYDIRNDYAGSNGCLLYTSPSPRDRTRSRMPSSA